MSDPVYLPPEPTSKKRARVEALVAPAIPENVRLAKKRIIASRKKRKPRKVFRKFGVAVEAQVAEALDLISERYDVTPSSVIRKFLQDGVRAYANEQELRVAGFTKSPKPNPFDPINQPDPAYQAYLRSTPEGEEHRNEVEAQPDMQEMLKNMPPFWGGDAVARIDEP